MEDIIQTDESKKAERSDREPYNYWRKETGKYLLILANVVAAGMVVRELTTDEANLMIAITGGLIALLLYFVAIRILKHII